jgi:chitin disaccharide deacetylase
MLIINADDWGRNRTATDTTLVCHANQRISATSAMVFMEDSERAAELARESGIDAGLHLNLSERFTASSIPTALRQAHGRICRFLTRSKYALLFYNPFLVGAFRFVLEAQLAEFVRLYDRSPAHFDGHQHMHLATNILVQNLIPAGQKVRRSFSFRPGQKSVINRAYRRAVDRRLARRYRLTDFFFALSSNLEPAKLEAICVLSRTSDVELMTHAWNQAEYEWLMSEACAGLAGVGRATGSARLRSG